MLWLLMVGVGIVYIDLVEIINVLIFVNVIIVMVIVFGVIIGVVLGGWVMGFYFVEVLIIVGLCMVNCGGLGDFEVFVVFNCMSLFFYV